MSCFPSTSLVIGMERKRHKDINFLLNHPTHSLKSSLLAASKNLKAFTSTIKIQSKYARSVKFITQIIHI